MEGMVEHIPCGLGSKGVYASMDWVDRYMIVMIMVAIKHYDDTHALVTDCCWRYPWTHERLGEEPSLANFQELRGAMVVIKSNYLHFLSDRDDLLMLDKMYHGAVKGK